MEYRKLGRTGLTVSAIGLGTEYLLRQPREAVVAVIHEAMAQGINYFDGVFAHPEYRDNLAAAFQRRREQVILAAHLGSAVQDDQYERTRHPRTSEKFFLDFLQRFHTDYADVLLLHNCDSQKDYDQLISSGGLLELAQRYRQEGKARFIGLSGHTVATAMQAVESGQIDVLMFPVSLAGNAIPGKKELLKACVAHDVAVVAMKPFAGGKLLSKERSVRVAQYQMGGAALKLKKRTPITPVQCLSYVLSQAGVSTTVPGCKDVEQLAAALAYWRATEEEKDFAALLAEFQQYVSGECVYCNHCLPCPSDIDIGQVMRLLDMAQPRLTEELKAAYDALPADAADCSECGSCMERCPFGVDVIGKMEQAKQLFA